MSPYAKSGLTLVGVVAALAVAFGLHYAIVQGVFESIKPGLASACRVIAKGLAGPEDLEIDAPHNAIIVSAGGSARGFVPGLYWLKLNDPAAAPVKLAGTTADFRPHGINLYRAPDGSETLMVTDRRKNGEAIEIYDLHYDGETPKLAQRTVMQGRLLTSPNDIAALSPSGFYVTNDHGSTNALGRWVEDYLFWPHSYVALSNGVGLRIAVQRIAYANGVLVSPDGGFLYIAAFNERRVIAMSREEFTGNLKEIGSLSLPAKPDNISMDAKGDLIVAGRTKSASAQVFRLYVGRDGVPRSYDTLYSDDGHILTRASSGAVWNGHLFIGSSRDDHMMECDVK